MLVCDFKIKIKCVKEFEIDLSWRPEALAKTKIKFKIYFEK